MIEVGVKFKKRLYGSPDGDFSVFKAEALTPEDSRKVSEDKRGEFSIAGEFSLSDDELGVPFTVTIKEDYSSKYPNSYKMVKLHYDFPNTADAQWEYLKNSNIIPRISMINISKTFGPEEKILDIIIEDHKKLLEVKGMSIERALSYKNKLLENRDKSVLFNEYGKIDGVSSNFISKMLTMKARVESIISAIEKDPFILIEELEAGFVLADRFREFYKVPLDDKNRILHGVSYYLNQGFQSTGNTYEDIFEASKEIAGKLFVSYKQIVYLLAEIQNDQKALEKYKLKIFGKNITTDKLYKAELAIYKEMKLLIKQKSRIRSDESWQKMKEEYLGKMSQTLSDEQDEFLTNFNTQKVSILLGPGGTGKSWVIKIVSDFIRKSGLTFGLFAPTARAAKVMSDYVGVEAKTIHRGLLTHVLAGETSPYDVLIVDEFSMVDSELANVILQAMDSNTRLIIVGDEYQLQSVGPGNVLFDLVHYLEVPTVSLTKVFRQGEGSKILDYAQALREGNFSVPVIPRVDEGDIVFINETDDSKKQDIAMKLYSDSLSIVDNDYNNMMLLSPTNKGPSGRKVLNKKVQELVNPRGMKDEMVFGANSGDENSKRFFRKDDFITIKSNQYDMIDDEDKMNQLINGDLGIVKRANSQRLTLDINDANYTIDKSEVNDLVDHAWTITIHKSQGGQADIVIIVLPENSYFMLNSNMLYTAITRARQKCYIIGNLSELNKAAKRQANYSRKTMIQLQTLANRKKDK